MATSLDRAIVPCRNPDVLSRTQPDGSVSLMHLESEEHYFTLTDIAADLWNLIDDARSLAEIEADLIVRHDPPRDRFRADVDGLVRKLTRERLLART